MPRVVWAEESKNGLGFELGPSYDDVSTTSKFLFDRQSSCIDPLSSNYFLLSKMIVCALSAYNYFQGTSEGPETLVLVYSTGQTRLCRVHFCSDSIRKVILIKEVEMDDRKLNLEDLNFPHRDYFVRRLGFVVALAAP